MAFLSKITLQSAVGSMNDGLSSFTDTLASWMDTKDGIFFWISKGFSDFAEGVGIVFGGWA